jgi:hypothetical protein
MRPDHAGGSLRAFPHPSGSIRPHPAGSGSVHSAPDGSGMIHVDPDFDIYGPVCLTSEATQGEMRSASGLMLKAVVRKGRQMCQMRHNSPWQQWDYVSRRDRSTTTRELIGPSPCLVTPAHAQSPP